MNITDITTGQVNRGLGLYVEAEECGHASMVEVFRESDLFGSLVSGAIHLVARDIEEVGGVRSTSLASILDTGIRAGWFIREAALTDQCGIDEVLAQIARDAQKGEQQ